MKAWFESLEFCCLRIASNLCKLKITNKKLKLINRWLISEAIKLKFGRQKYQILFLFSTKYANFPIISIIKEILKTILFSQTFFVALGKKIVRLEESESSAEMADFASFLWHQRLVWEEKHWKSIGERKNIE